MPVNKSNEERGILGGEGEHSSKEESCLLEPKNECGPDNWQKEQLISICEQGNLVHLLLW